MDFTLKSAEIKANNSKITLDRLDLISSTQLEALFVLLGGYNKYGRSIPLKNHRENMIAFHNLIEKVEDELTENI